MDDLISRQAAIDALRGYLVGKRCPDDGTLTCRLIENEVINKLPPIQPDNNSENPNSSDAISRQAAINAIDECYCGGEDSCGEPWIYKENAVEAIEMVEPSPPAEPKIIYCKDCRKHNKRIGDYVEKSDGTYDWIWKDQACPLAEFRGVAQGHEFDYQFCAYAERRTE